MPRRRERGRRLSERDVGEADVDQCLQLAQQKNSQQKIKYMNTIFSGDSLIKYSGYDTLYVIKDGKTLKNSSSYINKPSGFNKMVRLFTTEGCIKIRMRKQKWPGFPSNFQFYFQLNEFATQKN